MNILQENHIINRMIRGKVYSLSDLQLKFNFPIMRNDLILLMENTVDIFEISRERYIRF